MKTSIFCMLAVASLPLTSCISDEPLNAECDIETATVNDCDAETMFYTANDVCRSVFSLDSVITFPVRDGVDVSALSVSFGLTPGATITPDNGSVQDFSGDGVVYYVTSQDKQWHRKYKVRFLPMMQLATEEDFSGFELEPGKGAYYNLMAKDGWGHPVVNQWATGNSGFKLTGMKATPENYPTAPFTDEERGEVVRLRTCDTGAFGSMMKMPIAAGNLFVGTFDAAYALRDAMQATCFGLPFAKKPVRFSGWYKFTPGEKFTDRSGTTVVGRVDTPDLYAVVYRNQDTDGKAVVLHGDDVFTNPNIVALARVKDPVATKEWLHYDVEFEYSEPLNPTALSEFGYNLAIVFTSSVDGASFCGAVGSTLLVDDVKVTVE